jgi:DNA-binding transcriptional regulator YhcF (GntR family)
MADRPGDIRELLRQRIASGLHRGALAPGARLPSTRRLGDELGATPRTVMAAYAGLAREGLVELRRRSGSYVAKSPGCHAGRSQSTDWLLEVLLQGRQRGISPSGLAERISRCVAAGYLRAACIAGNADQADHLCRELRADYGLAAAAVDASRLEAECGAQGLLRRADLLVATALAATPARTIAQRLRKPLIIVRLRRELIDAMTNALRAGPVYFVATDSRFVDALGVIFGPMGCSHNLRPVILGRDDPRRIPAGAAVYILDLAHERLGDTPVTRRVRPIARVFSDDTAREILGFIIQANLSAQPGTSLPR